METWKYLAVLLHAGKVQVARQHGDHGVAVLLDELQGARIMVAVTGETEALGQGGLVAQGDQRNMAEDDLGLVSPRREHFASHWFRCLAASALGAPLLLRATNRMPPWTKV